MANTFDFIGNIVPCKVTDNFKPYEKRTFDSGWSKTTLKFNVACGNNRHFLEVGCFTPENIESSIIYTTKCTQSEDGSRSYDNIEVKYSDRAKSDIVNSIAPFKKFVVDTEIPKRRYQLESALEKFKDGTITDEQMTEIGVSSLEDCQIEYDKSCKRKHEFIWEYDFIEYLNKLINSSTIKDYKWHITGTYELEYNTEKDQWYRKFKPQRVYRALDSDEYKSQADFVVVFGKDAVDDSSFEETQKLRINGFIGQYLGKPYKKICYAPMTFTVDGSTDERAKKMAMGFKKKFTFPDDYEGEYREIGVTTTVLDGSQEIELTEDMLTDEQRENIEFGLTTLEDIKKELGKPVFGDRVTDIVVTGLARGYSNGANNTVYTAEDMGKPTVKFDEVENLFDEDDII